MITDLGGPMSLDREVTRYSQAMIEILRRAAQRRPETLELCPGNRAAENGLSVEEFLDLLVDFDRGGLAELAHWDGRQYRRFVDFLDRSLLNARANASYVRITINRGGHRVS